MSISLKLTMSIKKIQKSLRFVQGSYADMYKRLNSSRCQRRLNCDNLLDYSSSPLLVFLSSSVLYQNIGACRRTRSGFVRLVLRLVGVRLHRRYTAISPASPSLPVTKPLALGPTTGFSDRLLALSSTTHRRIYRTPLIPSMKGRNRRGAPGFRLRNTPCLAAKIHLDKLDSLLFHFLGMSNILTESLKYLCLGPLSLLKTLPHWT